MLCFTFSKPYSDSDIDYRENVFALSIYRLPNMIIADFCKKEKPFYRKEKRLRV